MPLVYDTIEYQREKCLEITGFEGSVKNLTIPEQIGGLAVRSIGRHAFERRADLQEVSLPASLRRLSLFAFHNCANLRKITLHDSVEDYYDGVIRQCGELEWIELYGSKRPYALMREMLEDNDHAMSFHLHLPEEEICLSFPSYALIASENTMARTIQFAYEGGGYAHTETACTKRRSATGNTTVSSRLWSTTIHRSRRSSPRTDCCTRMTWTRPHRRGTRRFCADMRKRRWTCSYGADRLTGCA